MKQLFQIIYKENSIINNNDENQKRFRCYESKRYEH